MSEPNGRSKTNGNGLANGNNHTETRLNRDLGLFVALSIGIGTMIGAGVFVLPGKTAHEAGPGVLVAFLICGVISCIIALCMSELATGMPHAGGGYLFVVRAFGPLLGAMIGWALWLSLLFASAFYMMGFGVYVSSALKDLFAHLGISDQSLWFKIFLSRQCISLVFTSLLILINYRGAKEAGWVQNVIVGFLLVILLLFVVMGVPNVTLDKEHFSFSGGSASTIFTVAALLFITYMGFAEISAISEEIKDPDRNLPRSMVGSVIIVTIMYLAVIFVLLGLVPHASDEMNSETVLMYTARNIMGQTGYILVLVGGILATLSSANASIMAASRVNFAMGRDRLLNDWVNEIHPRFRTPYRSIMISGGLIIVCLLVFGTHLERPAEVAAFLSLVLYALITLACIVMRSTDLPWYKPSFKVPLFPWLPLVGLFGCLFIISQMDLLTLAIGIGVLAASIGYFIRFQKSKTQLVGVSQDIFREKFIGSLVDRYAEERREQLYEVIVPVADEKTGINLVRIGGAFARHHKGQLRLVHVIPIPRLTALEAGRAFLERQSDRKELVSKMKAIAVAEETKTATNTIVSHSVASAILSTVDSEHGNLLLMGWRGNPRERERNIKGEVIKYAACDAAILRDRGLDEVKRILVPTRGGPHADLGLSYASVLAEQWNAQVTVLTVQKGEPLSEETDPVMKADLELFQNMALKNMRERIKAKGLEAECQIVTAPNVVDAIVEESRGADLLIMGASNEWRLRTFLFGSFPDRIADRAHCSVMMVKAKAEEHAGENVSPANPESQELNNKPGTEV